jgi:hypothetical protein
VTFLDILSNVADAAGSSAESYIASRPILGTIIRAGTAEGLSGSQILAAYRINGGRIANQTFWGLRGEILGAANRFENVAALLSGDRDAVQDIGGGKQGSYRVEMRAYYQREDEDGTIERGYQQFTLHQRDLDVGQALQDATSIWGDNSDTQSFPGSLLGLEVTGVYQYTGT